MKGEKNERSDNMDAKIKEKERKENQREFLYQKEVIGSMEKTRKGYELKAKKVKQIKQKQKQRQKDEKKKERKKRKVNNSLPVNEELFSILNVKNVPDNCKHLVKENDIVYIVPGDGCCGPNCAAAFLFHDEVYGPKLRRKMNIFFVKHWDRRYKFISQCSAGHPFKRKVKNGSVEFTDPEKLLNYLQHCADADFMWSDSEDLAIIADMFQINIKIITTKGSKDENPTTNWIYPDKSLEQFAELKNVKMNDMVLLHEDDNHFNLVISRDSDLVQFGSLSHRFNFALGKDHKDTDENDEINDDKDESAEEKSKSDWIELKKELNKCKKSKEFIEKEYIKCEKELRSKTEEAEQFKIEIKDLRKMIELREEIEDIGSDSVVDEEEDIEFLDQMKKRGFSRKSPQDQSVPKTTQKEFKCIYCDHVANSQGDLKKHFHNNHSVKAGQNMNKVKQMEEYNCTECDFQGSEEIHLRKHINLKHTRKDINNDGAIKCRTCGDNFNEKWDLMKHRKTDHPGTVAYCTKFEAGNCSFNAEFCWWSHEKKEQMENIQCFFCGSAFMSKSELMSHRKQVHSSIIRPCTNNLNGGCRFQEKFCWFSHKIESDNKRAQNRTEFQSDFQEAKTTQKPPSANKRKQF